jgi:CMP-N-acetylneuraminic acid synthetase
LGVQQIERVFVSTDDDGIRKAALAAGADVPTLRPDGLATDDAPTLPVIRHAIELYDSLGVRATAVVLVEPTSPFRTAEHVAAAVKRYAQGDCASVATVMPMDRKPENIFRKDGVLRRYIEAPRERFARRQDMAHLCRINSAVYVTSRDAVMAGHLLPEPIGFVEMDERSSINIDTELDLAFADFLARTGGI